MNFGGEGALSLREELQAGLVSVLNINVISDLIATVASILGNFAWALFAISLITFFLLREDKLITSYIITVVPEKKVEAFRHALESIKHLLRRYFVGILLQMTGILIMVTLGMTIVGVGFRLGLVIGLVAAVLNIVPYLGPWIGAFLGIVLGVAANLELEFATQLLPLIGYMTLVFAITPDASVRYQKLTAGECHIMPYPNPADVAAMQDNEDIIVLEQEGLNVGYLAYNASVAPYDNPKVRKALNMAIDKQAIIDVVFQGSGQIAKKNASGRR